MRDSRLCDYLDHILEASRRACAYVEGLSKEDFLADKRTQSAVVMSLVVIGEAATKVMDRYPGFADRHPDVPWRSMRGMRNRIAHGYFDLATPYFATEYTFNHLSLDPSLQPNISMGYYEAGHMMYIHEPSLAKLKQDLAAFIGSAVPPA